jgi:hydrogenase expression/formation protein HypD
MKMAEWHHFRDPTLARNLITEIQAITTHPWTLMEVCGGQTHAILRHGLDQLLPDGVELIHGPGCPVCVTPVEMIDHALEIAATPGVIFCTFGDMLRVPGSHSDLQRVKAGGGDVRVLYSPLDALNLARQHPTRRVVFFAIGFETTAPAHALTLRQAARESLLNFSMLVSLVRVPLALKALLDEPGHRVQAILAAGHVCSVMGLQEYPAIAERYRVPVIVTGFEPIDLLLGIRRAIEQLETSRCEVENAYGRAVADDGNPRARAVIETVFEECDREWRGMGRISQSGWTIRSSYQAHDAEVQFPRNFTRCGDESVCRSGEVLRGRIKPTECQAFGSSCTPRTPLGATMVSHEGACAAYYHAGRIQTLTQVEIRREAIV